MDPSTLNSLVTNYLALAVTVFTALVTGSSILLRSLAAYIKSLQANEPGYVPSKGLIIFMAVLAAIAQNSATASNILSDAKNK